MKYNFTLRVYRDTKQSIWGDMTNITMSNITLISKPNKFNYPCLHKSNQKRFNFTFEVLGKFIKIAGSNTYPTLTFKPKYIDIKVYNFPRYPVIAQCQYHARNVMQSGRIEAYRGDGMDKLHYEILNLTY